MAESKRVDKFSNFWASEELFGAGPSFLKVNQYCTGIVAGARNVAIRNWPGLCFVGVTANFNFEVLRLEIPFHFGNRGRRDEGVRRRGLAGEVNRWCDIGQW